MAHPLRSSDRRQPIAEWAEAMTLALFLVAGMAIIVAVVLVYGAPA